MEQSTVSETPLKDPMEPSRVPESPLKDPMEPSRVPESPLKEPERRNEERRNEENEERRNEKRWHEETRPRDPRLCKRPNFRPPYQRHHFKPRVFQRPPYAQQLMPTSQENAQVFFHSQGLAVLCIRNSGFTLTNGVVSYAMDRQCPHELFKFLHYLNVGTICVTDQHSKQTFKDIQASWSSSSPFKRTPVMLLNSNGRELGQCPFEDESRRFVSVDASRECTVDQIDAFPEHISTTVMPVTLPEKADALEYAARPGHVRACIIYQEPNTKRVFVLFCKDNWYQKKTLLYNFKPAILEAKHVNEFRPDDVLWEKISKGLLRNPDRPLKNTNKRMVYIYNNMFFVKKDFTFGFRTVKSG
ncbi:uncharacterized protein TNCV_4411051 [Trichonephila clavipes]|nr:uncharacterized protein TNCV_4411051 [Trichonephila clavipes]